MNITYPVGLIAAFIALVVFYTYNRKVRDRREERRERLNQKRQAYLDSLLKSKKN